MNDIMARFNLVAAFVAGVEAKNDASDRVFSMLCSGLQRDISAVAAELSRRSEKTQESEAERV